MSQNSFFIVENITKTIMIPIFKALSKAGQFVRKVVFISVPSIINNNLKTIICGPSNFKSKMFNGRNLNITRTIKKNRSMVGVGPY